MLIVMTKLIDISFYNTMFYYFTFSLVGWYVTQAAKAAEAEEAEEAREVYQNNMADLIWLELQVQFIPKGFTITLILTCVIYFRHGLPDRIWSTTTNTSPTSEKLILRTPLTRFSTTSTEQGRN